MRASSAASLSATFVWPAVGVKDGLVLVSVRSEVSNSCFYSSRKRLVCRRKTPISRVGVCTWASNADCVAASTTTFGKGMLGGAER